MGLLKMKFISILLLIVMLSSCAARNIKDTSPIRDGNGILLIKLSTNYNESKNGWLDNMKISFKSMHQSGGGANNVVEIISPGGYKIISLPSGTYKWGKVYMGRLYFDFDESSVFTIKPGAINYLGDVFVGYKGEAWGLKPHYTNIVHERNEGSAIEYLKNNYPAIFNDYGFQSMENTMRYSR